MGLLQIRLSCLGALSDQSAVLAIRYTKNSFKVKEALKQMQCNSANEFTSDKTTKFQALCALTIQLCTYFQLPLLSGEIFLHEQLSPSLPGSRCDMNLPCAQMCLLLLRQDL